MEQADLVRRVLAFLERLGKPYAVVGSYGSGAWGEARFTHDLDLVILLYPGDVPAFLEEFPAPQFYLSEDAVRQAVAHKGQFNLIHPESGTKVDFIVVADDPWSFSQLERRRQVELLPGLTVHVAAPEDVILGKMLYYREGGSEKHLRDITGILKVSGEIVDRGYIERWAGRLGVSDVWLSILRRLEAK